MRTQEQIERDLKQVSEEMSQLIKRDPTDSAVARGQELLVRMSDLMCELNAVDHFSDLDDDNLVIALLESKWNKLPEPKLQDNLVAKCIGCGEYVVYRPFIPYEAKKICLECLETKLDNGEFDDERTESITEILRAAKKGSLYRRA